MKKYLLLLLLTGCAPSQEEMDITMYQQFLDYRIDCVVKLNEKGGDNLLSNIGKSIPTSR